MDEKKLIKIFKQEDVRISKKGNICLNDFIENIIRSRNPKLYAKKLMKHKKIIIDGDDYISPNSCIDILKNTNFKRCKNICTKIRIDDGDKTSIIDVEQKIFQFEGHRFLALFVEKIGVQGDWDVYVQGSEIAKYLDYVDTDCAIRDHVDKENKISFFKFIELYSPIKMPGQKNIKNNSILINLSGFFNLIHCSKKPFALKIKKWLDNQVLPALINKMSLSLVFQFSTKLEHLIYIFNIKYDSKIKYP